MILAREEDQKTVRLAARALARSGFVHAYGHCSQRIDEDHFLVCAAKPMAQILSSDVGVVVPVHGDLPDGVLGEVRIHQKIYAKRPDVGGVCRTMPPLVMALGCLKRTPKPYHGFGSYFGRNVPLWDDPQLIRTDEQAEGLSDLFGAGRALVMRGNGAITAARDLEHAVVWTWYLEDAARIELEILKTGLEGQMISPDECEKRATLKGRIIERMWQHMTFGDQEL